MSRKLNSVLKNIPDVLELKIDEEELSKQLMKQLIAHGLNKDEASEIAKDISMSFVLRFADVLFIRQDLRPEKDRLRKLFDLLSESYLKLAREKEELIEQIRELTGEEEDADT